MKSLLVLVALLGCFCVTALAAPLNENPYRATNSDKFKMSANGCPGTQWKVLRLGGVSGKEDKGSSCSQENQFICKNGIKDSTNLDYATSYWVKDAQKKICINCGVHKYYQAATQSCQCENGYLIKQDGTCEKTQVVK